MDNFDFNDKPVKRPRPQLGIWDLLSMLILLVTLCIGGYFILVFVNPTTPLNPFPPLPTEMLFPTATITPIQPEPTWTPTFVDATDTPTLVPTFTLEPSSTPFSLVPPTKTPLATPTSQFAYNGTYKNIDSTIIHPEFGCNWQGVGGTVVDAKGGDVISQPVLLLGTFNNVPVKNYAVSGQNPEYGRSGFEFPKLGTTPVDSKGTLYVQLFSLDGQPVSNKVYINTSSACNQNLTLVRFKKNP